MGWLGCTIWAMQNPLTLRSATLVCHIKPELGGCIAGMWLGDIPVLRSTPAQDLHSVRQAASYPLVPFSNRVGQASLQWQGTSHPLVKNWAPDPHAIHGVGWERPWNVLEATEMWRESILSQKVRISVVSNGSFETMATP